MRRSWRAWTAAAGCGAAMLASGGESRPLFNGKDLSGWKKTDYVAPGPVMVLPPEPGADAPKTAPKGPAIYLGAGDDLTGITHTNPIPTTDYELRLDAMRVSGGDFFCGVTFPVGTNACTLILGGWGGTIVGLSSLDGMDASENETTLSRDFELGRWYDVAIRVTAERIQVDLDGRTIIDVEIAGRRVHMRPGEIEIGEPLSISTWRTAGAIRNIRIRTLPPPPARVPP